MRYFILILISAVHLTALGQTKLRIKVTINGSNNFKDAFLFYPIPIDTTNSYRLDLPRALKCDTINIEGGKLSFIDTTNQKKKMFYCIYNNQKSKIYNLDVTKELGQQINFVIPDYAYYDSLYKHKTCPLCQSSKNVVPLVYGKVGDDRIKSAQKGQIKLAGCSLSNTSPKFYCKTDCIEF